MKNESIYEIAYMEANQSEVEKLDLANLSVEYRRTLLDSMTESLRTATDPLDIRAFEIGIANLKKLDISPGQMLCVLELMDLYPRRAESKLDFDDMLFNAFNAKACPGDTFTVVERSEPRFHRDDTWYKVIAPNGSEAWVMACHCGVFYEPI
ncbi:SH3 domain-containing protein [bacterium]|nr:SH3 domain-containing protein [bacterium]